MSFQELCDHMLYSKTWQAKERLFAEAFPMREDRCAFFTDQVNRLLREYQKAGKSTEELNDLLVRKLAIDCWFNTIPASLLKHIDLSQ
jgi:hypothetical protein